MTNATPNSIASKVKAAKAAKAKRELDKRTARAVRVFSNAKRAIKDAEARKNKAEALIRESLGDAEIGIFDGMAVVEIMYSSNSGYDKETLVTRFPEAAAAAFRKTEYSYLKTV